MDLTFKNKQTKKSKFCNPGLEPERTGLSSLLDKPSQTQLECFCGGKTAALVPPRGFPSPEVPPGRCPPKAPSPAVLEFPGRCSAGRDAEQRHRLLMLFLAKQEQEKHICSPGARRGLCQARCCGTLQQGPASVSHRITCALTAGKTPTRHESLRTKILPCQALPDGITGKPEVEKWIWPGLQQDSTATGPRVQRNPGNLI